MEDGANHTNPIMCTQGCGFFGQPHTMNMCSKCYRDFLKKNEKSEKNEGSSGLPNTRSEVVTTKLDFSKGEDVVDNIEINPRPTEQNGTRKVNRCSWCNKKVGMYGFTCKCGHLFCNQHRHSAAHDCKYDYKAEERSYLEKTVKKVEPDRLRG